jgi:hypothetical protein
MVSIGEESVPRKGKPKPISNPSRGLVFKNNVFINNHPAGGLFIRNLTATPVTMRGNRFHGKGRKVSGPAHGLMGTGRKP